MDKIEIALHQMYKEIRLAKEKYIAAVKEVLKEEGLDADVSYKDYSMKGKLIIENDCDGEVVVKFFHYKKDGTISQRSHVNVFANNTEKLTRYFKKAEV